MNNHNAVVSVLFMFFMVLCGELYCSLIPPNSFSFVQAHSSQTLFVNNQINVIQQTWKKTR